jgi:SAM-dependent methyltransferase
VDRHAAATRFGDSVSEAGYTPQSMPARTRRALAERGARPVVGDLARWGTGLVTGLPWSIAGSHGDFELDGRRYRYLFHRHKFTWLTERAVEVPVAQALVDQHAPDRVLEIGNVLAHYRPQQYVVVDKYEQAPGVLNRDVLDLEGLGDFDLVVAISTLEHVGWDESPQDPDKAARAVNVLRSLLAPGGLLAITVPVGYNPAFDAALRSGEVPLDRAVALRRAGGNRWREVTPADVWSVPYDFLLYRARGVLFGFIQRPAA